MARKSPRSSHYHRARIRHFFLTRGLNRISGDRLRQRRRADGVELREIRLDIPGWPGDLDGLRIAHLSDLHIGDLMTVDDAIDIIGSIGNMNPDLICNTGDVVDLDCMDLSGFFEAAADLQPPLGNYLVLGNHDELDDPASVAAQAGNAGIHVLRNEATTASDGDRTIRIGGIDWARSSSACRRHVDAAATGDIQLLLSHNPKAFDRAAELGIPLTLSGHTHGGQIARKNRPNANLALAMTHRRNAGIYEKGDSRLFVTVGAGDLFPLRMNCPAEVVLLTIHRPADA
ncbi:MAG: hypothetical protein CMJ36_06135 [Phycisphaerae bacterium]|nr:hypothetical protein [Phycisphaerae bacterium]